MEEKTEEQAPPAEETPAPPAEGGEEAPAPAEGGEAPAEGEGEAPAPVVEAPPPPKPKNPADYFDEEQQAEIIDCFYYYDRRRQNKVATSDLGKMLGTLGKGVTDDDKVGLIKMADEHGTGYINLNGFFKIMKSLEGDNTHEEDVVTTFKLFDMNNKGGFGEEELRDVLGRLGPVEDETIKAIMEAADQDKDGKISRQEFLALFG